MPQVDFHKMYPQHEKGADTAARSVTKITAHAQ